MLTSRGGQNASGVLQPRTKWQVWTQDGTLTLNYANVGQQANLTRPMAVDALLLDLHLGIVAQHASIIAAISDDEQLFSYVDDANLLSCHAQNNNFGIHLGLHTLLPHRPKERP